MNQNHLDVKTVAKINELAKNLKENGLANNQTDAYDKAKEIILGIEKKVPQSKSEETLKNVEKEIEYIEDQIDIEIGKDMQAKVAKIIEDTKRHATGQDHAQAILESVSKEATEEGLIQEDQKNINQSIINTNSEVPEETIEAELIKEIDEEIPQQNNNLEISEEQPKDTTEEITELPKSDIIKKEENLFPEIENSLSKIEKDEELSKQQNTIQPTEQPTIKEESSEKTQDELNKEPQDIESSNEQQNTIQPTEDQQIETKEVQEEPKELDEMDIPMPDSLEKPKKEESKIYQDEEEAPPSEIDDFIMPEP